MKVTSRDVLGVLRRFDMASDEHVPRNIENLKISRPSPINTMASFRFNKFQFYILFDSIADDNVKHVINQIKTIDSNVKGELVVNPHNEYETFAIPFKGNDCYLFEAKTDKKRLDGELASRYPETSRSTWQKYIKAGYITVNNEIVKSAKHEISSIDNIGINLPTSRDYSDKELPILYIDDNVIVINKPAGILTHSKGALNDEFTVASFMERYSTFNLDTNRTGIVHRLDRDTSGIIVGARNEETAKMLQKQFSDRKTKKIYYAIVDGIPKHEKANIDLPIGRNPAKPSTFRVDANGKTALTKYEVIDNRNNHALLKLQLLTGRTHQLRVHMNYLNTPIHGDKVYGKSDDRMYLHAYSLEITLPGGNRTIFIAPLPNEFNKYFPDIKL